jgi:hypothetical protein
MYKAGMLVYGSSVKGTINPECIASNVCTVVNSELEREWKEMTVVKFMLQS